VFGVSPWQSSGRRPSAPYHLRVLTSLARAPRSLFWLGGAFVLLVLAVSAGVHHALDRVVAAALWQDVPCWGRSLGENASSVFAAELCVVYALAIGVVCLWARKPFAAVWIFVLLLAGVGLELAFKYNFTHPSPSAFLETVGRAPCGPPGPAYPFTVVPAPSTLPSGYSIRAAYFCLLLAGLIGARWPKLRLLAWIGLSALAVAAGASRVTVGWHWPTDVTAGLLLGAWSALLVMWLADDFAWLRPGETSPPSPLSGAERGSRKARSPLASQERGRG
jgi:membrane-associated phospholipid phosphatase